MNVFEALNESSGHCSAETLAQKLRVDPPFLGRIMRHLATAGILERSSADVYSMNARSEEMASPGASGAISLILETNFPFFARIPEALQKRSWRPSTSPTDSLWKVASGTDQTYYEWLAAQPQRMAQFEGMIQGFTQTRQPWVDIYPTEQLFDNDDSTAPVFVDVGGGGGHDIEEFRCKHPNAAGRLIFQDLPEVVEATETHSGISKQAHDFFTPQPVFGARVYFLHSILHNWGDDKCKEILLNLKPALRKFYSKIFVFDVVIQNNEPSQLSCAIDMRMLWNFGAGERSEHDWRQLFASAGMKVNHIWYPSRDGASIIELEHTD